MDASKREITDLTACRAIFAAWVFIYHIDLHAHFSNYLGPAAALIRRGYLGVDGFFILSGLILARVHPELAQSFTGATRFWGKRLARIYPVHLAVIILLAVMISSALALGLQPRDPERFTIAALLENILLIQGWGISDHLAWNYPSWSVSTEWAGYLLFPVFWFYIARWPNVVAGQLLVLCIPILGLVEYQSGQGLNLTYASSLLRFFPEFIMGITTAKLVPVAADYLPSPALALTGLCIAILCPFLHTDTFTVFGIWLAIAAFTMQYDAERPPMLSKLPFLRFLGVISYAFYMSFATVELLLAQFYRHEGWEPSNSKLIYAAAMTILTFILALALHFVVEKPARQLADRWLSERQPLAPSGVRL
jgi:peptidoglycan/LPS O-acetylase OafA/YrhL